VDHCANYKRGDKTDCSNYRGILYLLITYKGLNNILLSKLTSFAEEIIGDRQCGCRRNILCISQTLEKQWEYNEAVFQLFLNFKKASDLVMREVLYNILIELDIPNKLIRIIYTCVCLKPKRSLGRQTFV
jgi:hypothetical protein